MAWILDKKSCSTEQLFNSNSLNQFVRQGVKALENLNVGQFERLELNDELFLIAQKAQTQIRARCIYESHEKYIDIHLVIKGEEEFDIVDKSELGIPYEFSTENDYYLYRDLSKTSMQTFEMTKDKLAVMFFNDAHKGLIKPLGKNTTVSKLIIKITKNLFDLEFRHGS